MRRTTLARYVRPALPNQRIERQWDRVSAGLTGRPVLGGTLRALAAALAMTLVAVGIDLSQRLPSAADAFVVASLPEGRQELAFADGSRVTVAPGGRLRVDRVSRTEVAVLLEAGRANFEVRHDPARLFAVTVNDILVIDQGTRFSVERGNEERPGVDVSVQEGEVELRDPAHAEPRRLSAGESWSNRYPEVVVRRESPKSGPTETSVVPQPAPSGSTRVSGRRARVNGDGSRARMEASTARDLFEAGNRAKIEGRLGDAAEAFDTLRLRHRTDGHASLAAFELGRLRLNHLGDPAGALAALEDAVMLGPNAPLREEAEVRLIDALSALGRAADCMRARDQFLARHPHSVHASSVVDRCAAR